MTLLTGAASPNAYTVDDFRRRAAARAAPAPDGVFGDHRLNPDEKDRFLNASYRDAAVLIPVVDRPDEPTVLLTQRTATLRTHSGQIAFPGGRVDPEDHNAAAAAIRECEEETGIDPGHINVVGQLPDYMSGSGFRIVPVLSVVAPGFRLAPNPHEVDAVFEVPLSFLMSEANHNRGSRVMNGHVRYFYEMPYGDWYIWGVTAGIIRMMFERLYR